MKASQITPEFISKVNDVKNLKAIALGLITYRDKLTVAKNALKDSYDKLEERNGEVTLELQCGKEKMQSMQDMIQELLAAKESYEMQISDFKTLIQRETQSNEKSVELEKENQQLRTELEDLQISFNNQKSSYEQTIAQLQEQKIVDENDSNSISSEASHTAENEQLKSQISNLESQLYEFKQHKNDQNEIQIKINEQNEIILKLQSEIEAFKFMESQISQYKAQEMEKNAKLSDFSSQVSILKHENSELVQKLEKIQNKMQTSQAQEADEKLTLQQLVQDTTSQMETLEKVNEELNSELSTIKQEDSKLQSKITALISQNHQLQMQVDSFKNLSESDSANSALHNQISSLEAKEEEHRIEIMNLQTNLQTQAQLLEKSQEELKKAQSKISEIESTLSAERNENRQKQEKLQKLQEELDEKAQAESLQTKELLKAANQNRELENQINTLTKSFNETKEKTTTLESLVSAKLSQIESLTAQNDSKEQEISKLQSKIQTIQAKTQKDESSLTSANQKLQEFETLKAKNRETESSLSSANQKIQEIENSLMEANQKIEKLKRVKAKAQETENSLAGANQKVQELENARSLLKKQLDDVQMKAARAEANLKMTRDTLDQKCNQLQKLSSENTALISLKEENTRNAKDLESLKADRSNDQIRISELLNSVETLRRTNDQLEHDLEEARVNSRMVPSMEEVIKEKDQTIAKLQILVSRSVKNEERSRQQLEAYLEEQQNKREESAPEVSSEIAGQIVKLQAEKLELQTRLNESKPTKEAELKISKANSMVERSNSLYSNLLEKYQQLLQDQAERRSKYLSLNKLVSYSSDSITLSPQNPTNSGNSQNSPNQIDNLGNFSQNSNPVGTPQKATKLKPVQAANEEEMIGAYLKRVLLQFFLQDESKRSELVPLILELAGCNEQQIMAASRQWERSARLASKSTSIFGF